ncbi:MAG: ROK family protein [Rhodothermales bacterium]
MQASSNTLYGGIEAGGTKFVCVLGTGPDDIRSLSRFPTETPEKTLAQVAAFFREQPEPPAAVGIGSFGPVNPDPASPTYGYILNTPKPGWSHTDMAGTLRRVLNVPVAFDTDVNAAALGEHRWGAARDVDTLLYLTVGTGIGGGGLVRGQRLHGLLHPEMGHLPLPRAAGDDFEGTCPFHGACLEGLASGPALEQRWGSPPESLPPHHPAWSLEAHYLALALVHYILIFSPGRIILGGGVMHQAHLFPLIRTNVQHLLNGYVQAPEILDTIDQYIVPPALGDRAGALGALALAREGA